MSTECKSSDASGSSPDIMTGRGKAGKKKFRLIIVRPGTLGLKTEAWRSCLEVHDIPIDSNWIGNVIVDHLGRHPDLHVMTCLVISDNSQRVYQLIHTDEYKTAECKATEEIDADRNHLAEYLLPERRLIWGTAAIIAIDEDGNGKPSSSLTLDELAHIVNHRETATIITAAPGQCGKLTESTVSNAEIDALITTATVGNYSERQILGDSGYSISAWRSDPDSADNKDEPNWTASRILASRVTGTWTFAAKRAPGVYCNLSPEEVTQLSHVCAGATKVASLTDKEKKDNAGYITRYSLLRNRISGMVAKCQACRAVPEQSVWCGGCYRMRYCNAGCREAHWKEHRGDCSYVPNNALQSSASQITQ